MNYQTLRIMESLSTMDALQAEQVLTYIQVLNRRAPEEEKYKKFKRQAMSEIRKALGNSQESWVKSHESVQDRSAHFIKVSVHYNLSSYAHSSKSDDS